MKIVQITVYMYWLCVYVSGLIIVALCSLNICFNVYKNVWCFVAWLTPPNIESAFPKGVT